MESLNNETFVCDQECIETLCNFKCKYINDMDFDVKSSDLELIQGNIRTLIDKHVFPYLKTSSNKQVKPSKPNYFAIFMLILLDEYNYTSIKETFENLKKIVETNGNNGLHFNYKDIKIEYSLPEDVDISVCCCGQSNCSSYKMTRMTRGSKCFTVGSSCVLKTGINFNQICKDVKTSMENGVPHTKKHQLKSFQWVLNNDFSYLSWMYYKGHLDGRKTDNKQMIKHKQTIRSIIHHKINILKD